MEITLFYIIPLAVSLFLTNLMWRDGVEREDTPLLIFFSLVPGINILIALVSVGQFCYNLVKNPLGCKIKHDYHIEWDSEAEKWKDGRMPLRISMGGSTRYKCKKCYKQTSTYWKAF